jgi:hypothetical protein
MWSLPFLIKVHHVVVVVVVVVMQQVMMTGNEMERTEWFTDIEPLFKLLPYENVPPYLKVSLNK